MDEILLDKIASCCASDSAINALINVSTVTDLVVSYWWSIVTMHLSCSVREIKNLKPAFAQFNAHAPCHVTCRQGV